MDVTKRRNNSLQLQPRDLALLRGLFECRIMTGAHVATLFFDGKREYTKKRLQKLKAAGFIGERTRRVNQPSILFLTRKGFTLLQRGDHLSGLPVPGARSFEDRAQVRELTLQHELEIMDVKAAFHAALAGDESFALQEFSTWPLLHQFEIARDGDGASVRVKPDGYLSIHEWEEGTSGFVHDCFLEVDRSNETQDVLVAKANAYRNYYNTGGFAVRHGATPADFQSFPFRVLLVMKSAERRNNTAERLVQNNPPILKMTWLTTLAEVMSDPLGAIWIRPDDYRAATAGTPFDAERVTPVGVYRRLTEREAWVETKIKKRRLLTD